MDKQERVLLIMYGKGVGGAELQFIELANYLANRYQVRLLSLGGDGALRAARVDPNIDVRVYPFIANGVLYTAIAFISAYINNFLYPARRIVTTSFIANALGMVFGAFRKSHLVSLQTVSKCMRRPALDRFVLKRFDVLIAGADDIKNSLVLRGQDDERIQVVHNWVDFTQRKPTKTVGVTRNKLGVEDQIIIGCIGRLHPQKGQIYLLRAFADVLKEFSDLKLLLVGDGETRQELEHEVSVHGIESNVIFTGTATSDEYNNYLAVIDIYVQPSVFEGLPRTLLDAMHMAKAIVATNINGNKEAIIDGVNGLLVSSKSSLELKSAITKLLHDRSLRDALSSNAKKTAKSKFDMVSQLGSIDRIVSCFA